VFTYETANVKGEIERKFSAPKVPNFWRFSGPSGQGLEKVSIFTAKGTSINTWIHVVRDILCENWLGV